MMVLPRLEMTFQPEMMLSIRGLVSKLYVLYLK